MNKNFVDYDDITAITRKLKNELDKKAVVIPITQEEYDQLSPAEQNNGTIYFITNYNGTSGTNNNIVNNIVRGYYRTTDGKIYNEPGFTTEVVKSANYLYIDLGSNDLYIYDTTNGKYILVSGGDGIKSIKMNGSTVQPSEQGEVNLGTVLTSHQDISGKQDKTTAVKYGGSAAVGSATKGVYIDAQGNTTAMAYELNISVPAPPSNGYNTKFLRADGTWNDPNIIKIKSLEVRKVGTEINANDVEQDIYEIFWPNLYGDRTWNMYDQNKQFVDGVKDYFPPKGTGYCVTTLENFSNINIIDVHGVWENNGFKYPLFNSKIETYFYSPASMIQIYVNNLTDENIDRGSFYLWIRFYADKNN